jgi:hypothetical protein
MWIGIGASAAALCSWGWLAIRSGGCGTEQVLPAGPRRCRQCRLAMIIEVEEPRCACGSLLVRLEADRCPECGRDAPAAASRAQPPAP